MPCIINWLPHTHPIQMNTNNLALALALQHQLEEEGMPIISLHWFLFSFCHHSLLSCALFRSRRTATTLSNSGGSSGGDWRDKCRQILDIIWNNPDSVPFREPVDTIEHQGNATHLQIQIKRKTYANLTHVFNHHDNKKIFDNAFV